MPTTIATALSMMVSLLLLVPVLSVSVLVCVRVPSLAVVLLA
jgi:hypothetical protein